jgi:WD40 repeat protein
MVRVTDHAAEPPVGFARNDYSRRVAFNATGDTLLIVDADGAWHLYDARSLAYLRPLRALSGDAEPQWDPSDPQALYFVPRNGGLVLNRLDLARDTVSVVGAFGDRLPWRETTHVWTRSEGSPSADARYWAFMADSERFEGLGMFVWDRQRDRVLWTYDFASHGRGRPDHVSMSPSGRFLVASWDDGTSAFDYASGQERPLHGKSEHSDLGSLAGGDDVYVSVDYDSDRGDVFMVNLANGRRTVLFPSYVDGTATALHFSGKAYGRPGWILVSTYATQGSARKWLHEKLLAVELEADPTILHVAHHRSRYRGYWTEPHATVNRDFTRVLFNSNWEADDDTDVDAYMVALPPGTVAPR